MRKFLEPVTIVFVALTLGFGISAFFSYLRDRTEPLIPFTKSELSHYFFQEKVSHDELVYKYHNDQPIKILLVAGHNDEYPGALFENTREVDLNIKVANYIYDILKNNPHFETYVFQKEAGVFDEKISVYLGEKDHIENFKTSYQRLAKWFRGEDIDAILDDSLHTDTPEEIIQTLYAINAWANDGDIDIVIHIHFNDVNGRTKDDIGNLSGFSIYTPGDELINKKVSYELAASMEKQLLKILVPSDNPEEKDIIIKNDSLIALGAFNTLNSASILIEYGFIYEEKFQSEEFLKNIARVTYLGLQTFLEK